MHGDRIASVSNLIDNTEYYRGQCEIVNNILLSVKPALNGILDNLKNIKEPCKIAYVSDEKNYEEISKNLIIEIENSLIIIKDIINGKMPVLFEQFEGQINSLYSNKDYWEDKDQASMTPKEWN